MKGVNIMKLGAIVAVYVIFGLLAGSNRIGNTLVILTIAFAICAALSIIGWFFRSDHMVSFWMKMMRRVIVLAGFGVVAMFTWQPLLGMIFK